MTESEEAREVVGTSQASGSVGGDQAAPFPENEPTDPRRKTGAGPRAA